MSTTQWGIISLIYNETLDATTPAIVKDDLAKWLTFSQEPPLAQGCYQGPASPGICDHSDTGGLLLGLKFVGKTTSDTAVQKALGFLNTNWKATASGTWYGNFGHPYAMWSVYKGLEVNIGLDNTTVINNLRDNVRCTPTCPATRPAANPATGGKTITSHWSPARTLLTAVGPAMSAWYGPLATAFNVNILGATPIPVENRILDDFNRSDPNNPTQADTNNQRQLGRTGAERPASSQYALEGFWRTMEWQGGTRWIIADLLE